MKNKNITYLLIILVVTAVIGVISSASSAYFRHSIENHPIQELIIEYDIK